MRHLRRSEAVLRQGRRSMWPDHPGWGLGALVQRSRTSASHPRTGGPNRLVRPPRARFRHPWPQERLPGSAARLPALQWSGQRSRDPRASSSESWRIHVLHRRYRPPVARTRADLQTPRTPAEATQSPLQACCCPRKRGPVPTPCCPFMESISYHCAPIAFADWLWAQEVQSTRASRSACRDLVGHGCACRSAASVVKTLAVHGNAFARQSLRHGIRRARPAEVGAKLDLDALIISERFGYLRVAL